ncbi:MAG: DUF4013 domain-containing protein [Nannocystaceae bacterium]|nr:DUF4013 domain-containing protein [Nannocystaceae bacterium]
MGLVLVDEESVRLTTTLSIGASFRFPLQSARSRREILVGAALLLIPLVGWLLNMGHRIQMVQQMQRGEPAWPAWHSWGTLLRHGTITFVAMLYYHAPASLCFGLGAALGVPWLHLLGAALWIGATALVPGFMTQYCLTEDVGSMFNPLQSLRRVREGGRAYWHAWSVAVAALLLSFVGLLGLGVFFLVTSVWFWQVAGFSFATVFSPDGAVACARQGR